MTMHFLPACSALSSGSRCLMPPRPTGESGPPPPPREEEPPPPEPERAAVAARSPTSPPPAAPAAAAAADPSRSLLRRRDSRFLPRQQMREQRKFLRPRFFVPETIEGD